MNLGTNEVQDDAYDGRSLVAAFGAPEQAREAARALHDEGFRRVWIGVTRTVEGATPTHVVENEDDSLVGRVGRFFSGQAGERALYEELVRHGVAESEARRLDTSLPASSAVLTVDGHNHPELAAQIIEQNGGHVVAGEAFGTTTAAQSTTAAAATTGSQILGHGDPSRYARGEEIDEQRRIQLREERLTIDKEQVPLGEARITKDVVEHRQDVDVPVIREELFVERRPVAETDAVDAGPITEGEAITIPLIRENVVVTKRPVVTGEVVVGKRGVTDVQHVSETTREEQVQATGPQGAVNSRGHDGDTASSV